MTPKLVRLACLFMASLSSLSCNDSTPAVSREASLQNVDLALAARGLEGEAQPLNEVFSAEATQNSSRPASRSPLPADAYSTLTNMPVKKGEPLKPEVVSKIEPRLRDAARKRAGLVDPTVEVIVTFKDSVRAPRLPRLDPERLRESPENQQVLSRIQALRDGVIAQRSSSQRSQEGAIVEQHRGKIKHRFWLINGYVAELPLSEVEALAERPEVQRVEYTTSDAPPPNSIVTARSLMNTDWIFNLGLNSGWVGLVDTGVTLNHSVLLNPNRIDYRRDCHNSSDLLCATPGPNYNADDCGNHGTGMASIVSGNNNLGDNRRGFSGITVDSFKMYVSPSCAPSRTAGVRAIEAAMNSGDSVILVEAQDDQDEYGALATAADRAFDHGVVVIAANGNYGGNPRTTRSPANAQKVLGIGAINPDDMAVRWDSSRGPTNDFRTKPDLMALDKIDRATTAGFTTFDWFTGTSTASAVATGGLALLNNWMHSVGTVDPGQVYATAIAMADGLSGSAYDYDRGAGLFVIPSGATVQWGAVSLVDNQVVTIQRNLAPTTSVRVAIWWPEITTTHNDIDLGLTSPGATQSSSSTSVYSVFEKVRTNSNQGGTWTFTINGYNVISANPQIVYWALVAQ